jgi:iron complex transport system ATP-binding protein
MNHTKAAPVLTCRDLVVGYKDKIVLKDMNLAFEAGRFITLLGPNGAGKTTLLRTLSRHLEPISGRIHIMGHPLSKMTAMELAKFMAVVLTDKVSPPLFTVFEFVALGRYPHTDFLGRMGADDHAAVQKALAAVQAENLSLNLFTDLSDGERQKALVARALAQEPRLLLLDEPTIHLDLKHRMEVTAILRDLCRKQGITVVASLHDVDLAAKVSDQVALVKNGTITAWGSPEAVLKRSTVADLYDFSGADFDHHLGGIELRGSGSAGRVFVAAGMGSGAIIYRLLAKRGFAISTGVLHENDLDYYVARSLGAKYTAQAPMATVNGNTLEETEKELDRCDLAIDCGFAVGPLNQGNLRLLDYAAAAGKTVLSLRPSGDQEMISYRDTATWINCRNLTHLIEILDNRFCIHSQCPSDTKENAS